MKSSGSQEGPSQDGSCSPDIQGVTDRISKMWRRADMESNFKPTTKVQEHLVSEGSPRKSWREWVPSRRKDFRWEGVRISVISVRGTKTWSF